MKGRAAVAEAVVAVTILVILSLSCDRDPGAIHDEGHSLRQQAERPSAESSSLAGGKLRSSGPRGSAGSIQFSQPTLQGASAIEKILALSSPEVRNLFDQGLERLDEGYFLTARQFFSEILLFENDNAIPLAQWSIGLTHYREGGTENLMLAAYDFGKYCQRYRIRLDLEEFTQAAAINIVVITIELSKSPLEDNFKRLMAEAAIKLMSDYRARWPQGPHAQAARVAIVNLQKVLDGLR